MSREIGLHKGLMVDDFGLGKGQDFLIFVSTLDLRLRALNFRLILAKISEDWKMNCSQWGGSILH